MVGLSRVDLNRLSGDRAMRDTVCWSPLERNGVVEFKSSHVMCLSSKSGISSNTRLSRSTLRNRCSNAREQWAIMCNISDTKCSSVVILLYQLCTNSLMTIASRAYN